MTLFRDSDLIRCVDGYINDCISDTEVDIICDGIAFKNVNGIFTSLPVDNDFGESKRQSRESQFTFFTNQAKVTEKNYKDCRIKICDDWYGVGNIEIYHDGTSVATLTKCKFDVKCNANNKCAQGNKRRDRHNPQRRDSGDRKPQQIQRLRNRHG